MKCIVSYYKCTNKIHDVYNSIEEAKKDVRFLNIFSAVAEENYVLAKLN